MLKELPRKTQKRSKTKNPLGGAPNSMSVARAWLLCGRKHHHQSSSSYIWYDQYDGMASTRFPG